ncbi:MSC_0620 family F1-like ATPase-associated subunit [Metamycoplasma alkalescens]|uniref:Transmembrane protein n=2 Tax=Metamycoplasma alkalescens TaxID=45363 RepID=A0A318UCV9_9BACT|nr:hypothetical protein [Metamycoplasma alkalescens]PYF43609.1 hypothetical protein BCF88_10333 [Metamycoplasma alkalescens]
MKIKTKLWSFSLIPGLVIPMTLISYANLNQQSKREESSKQENKKEEPKVASDFSEFKTFAQDKLQKGIETLIKDTEKFLDSERKKIEEELNSDFKKNIANIDKLIYLQVLIKYLKDNGESLKTNHANNHGFNVVFPYLMANNQKYDIANIKYDGEDFEEIKVGKETNTDYSKQIKGENNKIEKKQQDQTNSISKEKLEKLINKYISDLSKELKSMLYDEKDIPVVGKDIQIKFKDNNLIEFTTPAGFDNWDKYIISKLEKKFIKFDLKQNKDFKDEEEKQEEKKEDEPIEKPDLVPGDKPDKEVNVDEQIRTLPLLFPNVSYTHTNNSVSTLVSSFNSAASDQKKKIFFFDNPINTRYEYSVASIEASGNNAIKATIKITDLVAPNKVREYSVANIKIDTSNKQKAFNKVYEKTIQANQELFSRLYLALGIDHKVNYTDLRHNNLRKSLFDMVGAGVQVINQKEYNANMHKIINDLATSYGSSNNEETINRGLKNSKYLFLTSLFSSKINEEWYFNYLTNALKGILLRFKEITRINEKIIQTNFINSKLNLDIINQYYDLINKQISRLIATSSKRVLNIFAWYDFYLKSVKEIIDNFAQLGILVDNKSISDEKILANFKKTYANVKEIINKEKQVAKNTLNYLGYGLLGIFSILLLSSIIFIAIKRKQLRALKIKKISGLVIAISLSIVIAAILMIIL